MSKEIEAWCSIVRDCVPELFNTECSARQHAERYGGIAVKLTGKMPRELRKVSTEVWITPCDIYPKDDNVWARLGVWNISTDKKNDRVRCLITLEELPEEGE